MPQKLKPTRTMTQVRWNSRLCFCLKALSRRLFRRKMKAKLTPIGSLGWMYGLKTVLRLPIMHYKVSTIRTVTQIYKGSNRILRMTLQNRFKKLLKNSHFLQKKEWSRSLFSFPRPNMARSVLKVWIRCLCKESRSICFLVKILC